MDDTGTDDTGPVDWRGTPITPGALVIYGAPVGRSIALVEATVADPMLSPSGRIWLDVIRRAYGYSDMKPKVHVGADRLTVVTTLPPTSLPTDADKYADEERRRLARNTYVEAAHEAEGHDGPPWGQHVTRERERQRGWAAPPERQTWEEWKTCDGCLAARDRFDEQSEANRADR